jgi:ribosome-associated protein
MRAALDEQHNGSAAQTPCACTRPSTGATSLIADDATLARWLQLHPDTDTQQLRALVRQARKDTPPDAAAVSQGLAPRHGRAYREIFQLVKEHLGDE